MSVFLQVKAHSSSNCSYIGRRIFVLDSSLSQDVCFLGVNAMKLKVSPCARQTAVIANDFHLLAELPLSLIF